MRLADYTTAELKNELRRREKEKEKEAELLASADYKKRMNIAIKKEYSQEAEDEITAVMLMEPGYENNIQKALTWGIKTKSKRLAEVAIKTYNDFSKQRYLAFVPFGIELEDILFMFEIDPHAAKQYLNGVFPHLVENELLLLRMKRQGGAGYLYHEWQEIYTGYDREIHRVNRNKINDVLKQAEDHFPYSRIFRKCIIEMLRYAQSITFDDSKEGDFAEAVKFLRWSGAKWGRCGE